jgi:hypothetical protein
VPAADVEAVVLKSVREQVSSQRPIDDRLLIETHVVRVEVHTDHLIIKLVQAESEEDDVALEFLNPDVECVEIVGPRIAFLDRLSRAQSARPAEAGIVEGWRGLGACCVDLGVGAAASPLRGASGGTDRDPNDASLSLQPHLAVRHR